MDLDDALGPLRAAADASVIVLDFDGTLSPIVDDPADAAPVDGVSDLLVELSHRYAGVVIVSGRPLDFLLTVLPSDVGIVGLYGLEGLEHGRRWEHPNGGVWREVIDDVVTAAPGLRPRRHARRVEGPLADLPLPGPSRARPDRPRLRDGQGRARRARRAGPPACPSSCTRRSRPTRARWWSASPRTPRWSSTSATTPATSPPSTRSTGSAERRADDQGRGRQRRGTAELLEQADLVVDGPERVLDLLASLAA